MQHNDDFDTLCDLTHDLEDMGRAVKKLAKKHKRPEVATGAAFAMWRRMKTLKNALDVAEAACRDAAREAMHMADAGAMLTQAEPVSVVDGALN